MFLWRGTSVIPCLARCHHGKWKGMDGWRDWFETSFWLLRPTLSHMALVMDFHMADATQSCFTCVLKDTVCLSLFLDL